MQQTVNPAVVTPSGVRDGDPAALHGLCERRGASVSAYCHEVCGAEEATRAAAEAFARFRAAVVALDDLTTIDPEALLLSATRHAAASLATIPAVPRSRRRRRRDAPAPQGCEDTPELLIGRVEGTLDEGEQRRLTSHLEHCDACRALKDMFRRAEVLYRDPGTTAVPSVVARAIVDALAAAAPLAAVPPAEDEADLAAPEPEPLEAAAVAVETSEPDEDQDVDEAEPPRRRSRRRPKTLEFPPLAPQAEAPVAHEEDPDDLDMPPVAPDDEAAMARVFPDQTTAPPRSGRGLPRPPRQPVPADGARRHGRARAIALPAGIVVAAVAGALGIAGVFGGDAGSPPAGGSADDQLFPKAVLRAPARGTAAAAAAEIARIAEIDRRRAERNRRLRRQGAAVTPAGGGYAPSAAGTPAATSAAASRHR